MKFIILFISILIIYSQKNQYFHFLRKHTIYSELNNLFQSNIKEPVILNGIKSSYKKTLCVSYSLTNNILFKEYSLNKFIKDVPHLKYENSIPINSFMSYNDIHQYMSNHGKIFLFLGEGKHKIKKKAEQIACDEAIKALSNF